MARINFAASPTKALGKKGTTSNMISVEGAADFVSAESKIRKSLDAAAIAVRDEQTQHVLIALAVAVCMLFALNPRRIIDLCLVILLLAPYPPVVNYSRWLLVLVMFSGNMWWKVNFAAVFACFSAIGMMDWDYAIDRVKNCEGIQI